MVIFVLFFIFVKNNHMRKIILSILCILGIQMSKGQNFEYTGPINKEIISKMDGSEILLYLNCLEHIGETTDSVNWLPTEMLQNIKKNIKKFRSFVVEIDTQNNYPRTKEFKGKKKLNINKFFFHLERFDNFSKIQLYQLI